MKSLKVILFIIAGASPLTFYAQQLIDKDATPQAKALYVNLDKISKLGFLFGHQDTDAYGVKWKGEKSRSDVKDICGSYPAVHGWDVGKSLSNPANIDGVPFKDMVYWIQQTYERGGINAVSWHWDNPVTKGDSWDKTPAVKDILPGGSHHHVLRDQLDLLAGFFNKCESDSVKIPVIFRPWHEHNGDWFWWGKGNCTEEEYVQLFRFTVGYLRNEKNIHHLIYAYSPDRGRIELAEAKKGYMYAYPGDEYVDIIGLDNYRDVGIKWNKRRPEEQRADLISILTTISEIAKEKNKVAALTETGLEGVTNPNWFTQVILDPIKTTPKIQIAYVLVWRNANESHHYAPYKGHSAEKDFIQFCSDEKTFLENDLQNMYQTDKPLLRR